MIPNIGLFDVSLGFIYLFLIYFFAILYKQKKIKKNPEYKYFLWGLTAKIIGGIGFVLYSTYYKPGDTFGFFNTAKGLTEYFLYDFNASMKVMFASVEDPILLRYNFARNYNYLLKSSDTLSIVKITAIFNFISFNSYLVSSIIFAFISFLGLWFGYSNLCKLYPKIAKHMLVAFLLIPTSLLWSSGILKDTVTQGCIGWLLYAFSNLFIFKRKLIVSLVVVLIGGLSIFLLKPYLLYVLIPCLFIWVQSNFKHMIKNALLRVVLKPVLIVLLVGVGVLLFQEISAGAGKYSAEKIEKTLGGFHSWHEYLADNRDQSGYSLGEVEFTPLGVLKKSPAALNVTLFRPYLWEVRNVSTMLGALEALVLLIYLFYLFITLRMSFFRMIFKNKEVFFMMIFSILFGIVVGISSYNFGALSRYKIPVTMFFVLSLIIIQHEVKKESLLTQ